MQVVERPLLDRQDNILRRVRPRSGRDPRSRGQVLVDSARRALAIDPFDRTLRKPGMLAATSPVWRRRSGPKSVMADIVARERDRSYLPVVLVRNVDRSRSLTWKTSRAVQEWRSQPGAPALPHSKLAAHLWAMSARSPRMRSLARGWRPRRRGSDPAPRIRMGCGGPGGSARFRIAIGGMNQVRLVGECARPARRRGLAPIPASRGAPPLAGGRPDPRSRRQAAGLAFQIR